jgi:hypothetical protein
VLPQHVSFSTAQTYANALLLVSVHRDSLRQAANPISCESFPQPLALGLELIHFDWHSSFGDNNDKQLNGGQDTAVPLVVCRLDKPTTRVAHLDGSPYSPIELRRAGPNRDKQSFQSIAVKRGHLQFQV